MHNVKNSNMERNPDRARAATTQQFLNGAAEELRDAALAMLENRRSGKLTLELFFVEGGIEQPPQMNVRYPTKF